MFTSSAAPAAAEMAATIAVTTRNFTGFRLHPRLILSSASFISLLCGRPAAPCPGLVRMSHRPVASHTAQRLASRVGPFDPQHGFQMAFSAGCLCYFAVSLLDLQRLGESSRRKRVGVPKPV